MSRFSLESPIQRIRRQATAILNKSSFKSFVTTRRRPIKAHSRHPLWVPDYRDDTAIVLQGPLVCEKDFTLETVRRYRTSFPNAPIIVSTWDDERGMDLDALGQLGALIVVQKKPFNAGVKNTNMQMASSALGIQKAATLGVSHVIKTRTDQRAYSDRLLSVLHSSIMHFPLTINPGTQSQRVVGLSLNSFAYRLYGLSDMFTFGATHDLIKYWNGILDDRDIAEPVIAGNHREFSLQRVCEVKFCSDFLSETGWSLQWTLADSWGALAARFLVLDACSIDLYWPKYSGEEERWRTFDGNPRFQEVDFALWLSLFSGSFKCNESAIDYPWW